MKSIWRGMERARLQPTTSSRHFTGPENNLFDPLEAFLIETGPGRPGGRTAFPARPGPALTGEPCPLSTPQLMLAQGWPGLGPSIDKWVEFVDFFSPCKETPGRRLEEL